MKLNKLFLSWFLLFVKISPLCEPSFPQANITQDVGIGILAARQRNSNTLARLVVVLNHIDLLVGPGLSQLL